MQKPCRMHENGPVCATACVSLSSPCIPTLYGILALKLGISDEVSGTGRGVLRRARAPLWCLIRGSYELWRAWHGASSSLICQIEVCGLDLGLFSHLCVRIRDFLLDSICMYMYYSEGPVTMVFLRLPLTILYYTRCTINILRKIKTELWQGLESILHSVQEVSVLDHIQSRK